jgi:hypothetical protein
MAPLAGDGTRYACMRRAIDPSAPTRGEMVAYWSARLNEVGNAPTWKQLIEPEIAALFGSVMPSEGEDVEHEKPSVDWSFLDRDDGQPGEPADWVKKQIKLYREHADEIYEMHRWTRQIQSPASPRQDPNQPAFDASEILGAAGWEGDDDVDADDDLLQSSA